MIAALLITLLTPTAPAEAAPERDVRLFGLPNLAYDTDDGLGYGARLEVNVMEGDLRPYKEAYVVQAYMSNRGYHHHRLRYDRLGLGRFRLTTHLAWRQWKNDGYYGMGNATAIDPEPANSKRYRYTLYQPFSHTTLQFKLSGPWRGFSALAVRYSQIDTYDGSLLGEARPFGMGGGLSAELHGGILYDSREPEVNATEGVLLEVSGRYAAPGAGHFGGIFGSARGFTTPLSRLTLAGRVMAEWLFGEVPFYEMVHWGGAIPTSGFGGSQTLRGVSFGRWRGKGKGIVNLEARARVGRAQLLGNPADLQLAPFLDLGLVFDTDTPEGPTGEGWLGPIHPGAGLGTRVIYNQNFVIRADLAFGEERYVDADGEVYSEASFGIYIVFDQAF